MTEATADVDAVQTLDQHILGEEVALDELAQAAPDLVLAARDDRRVRDRDTEWVAEQRRHGEPVGERTDHRRLGAGPHVTDPVPLVLVRLGEEEDDRGEHQQRRRDGLHPPEVVQAGGLDRLRKPAPYLANCVVASAALSSHSGNRPTAIVKPTAAAMARPDDSGTASGWRASSSSSDIQEATMIRR